MADAVGQADIRDEHIEKIVSGFALQEFRIMPLCTVVSSNAWSEVFYRETATELTGGLGSSVEGVPRLAAFPYGEVTWTKVTAKIVKHGMEGVISYEDIKANAMDVLARTLLRIARAVAKSVDTEVWDALTESRSVVNINSVSITAGNEWDSATLANRDPIQNILDAKKEIAEENYDPDNGKGFLLLNPKDYANLLGNANVRNAGQFYTDDVTRNGRVGKLLGLNVIVSNVVTADYALVGIAKECATWRELMPLKTVVIDDPGIKKTVRAWQAGVTQLTNPKALCLISNTAA